MASKSLGVQLSLGIPGGAPDSTDRLAADWREVEVPSAVLAAMLGCRSSHLQQNYGHALVASRRGLYRLESVARAVQMLHERESTREDELAGNQEFLRLRNAKIRTETHRIELATSDFVARLKKRAREEIFDELADLCVRLRDEVSGMPAEMVAAHNAYIEAVAARLDPGERRGTRGDSETTGA